jgi:ribosomal protein S18 acetylase RimI-like enzyme
MRRMVRPIDEAGLFLSSLAVQPEAQGAGVGAALLAGVFDKARRLGLAHVECDVETDNEGALRFYRRFGFRPVGERRAGIFRSRLGFAGYVRIRCELAPAGPAGGPAKGG